MLPDCISVRLLAVAFDELHRYAELTRNYHNARQR